MRISLGSRRHTREEALAWLARLERGLRPGEGEELVAWLGRRSHRRFITKAAVDSHGPEVLAILASVFPIDPGMLQPPRRTHPAIWVGAALVSVCITLFPVELGLLARSGLLHQKDPWITTTFKAPRRLTLKDGTRVALNRGTGINVTYLEHLRSVFIARGEALFTVASEPYRPFEVRAAGRALGTTAATFDVRLAGPRSLIVTVLKGQVTVYPSPSPSESDPAAYQPILLEPLQMLVIEPGEQSGKTLTPEDVLSRFSWPGDT